MSWNVDRMVADGTVIIRTWNRQQGGQQAGVDTSIIAVHVPTGCAFMSASERSQFRNKENALDQLEALVRMHVQSPSSR